MPSAGLEPARYHYRGILSPLRLPISSRGRLIILSKKSKFVYFYNKFIFILSSTLLNNYTIYMYLNFFITYLLPFIYFFLYLFNPHTNLSGLSHLNIFYFFITAILCLLNCFIIYQLKFYKISFYLFIFLILTLIFSSTSFPNLHLLWAVISFYLFIYPLLKLLPFYPNMWQTLIISLCLTCLIIIHDQHISGLSEYCFLYACQFTYNNILKRANH